MAQLVLGVAGAAIGGMVGGPMGAKIGWMAGAFIGGIIDPPNAKTSGPRLTDLSVQSSSYGGMRPIIYGSMRTAGNVIFCTDKREVASSASASGKGGLATTSTTYTYNVDIAVALCANPIGAIRKIWNNGQLIYDMSSGADLGTAISSNVQAAAFKVYLGTESQLPDPTLEATLGVGNVPAYRGTPYVVFTQLDCPNGQIPQLSFEVLVNGVGTALVPVVALDFQAPVVTMGTTPSGPVPTLNAGSIDRCGNPWTLSGYIYYPMLASVGGGLARFSSYVYSTTGQAIAKLTTPASGAFALAGDFSIDVIIGDSGSAYTTGDLGYIAGCCDNEGVMKFGEWQLVFDVDSNIGGTPSRIIKFTLQTSASMYFLNNIQPIPIQSADYRITVKRSGTTLNLYYNGALVGTSPSAPQTLSGNSTLCLGTSSRDQGTSSPWHSPKCVFKRFILCSGAGISGSDVPLSGIIADVCARAGLSGAQLDTSLLADTVTGYALTQVSPARANLLPVQQYGFVDGTESDGILKWTPRAARVSVATVPYDDLATEMDGTAPGDPLGLQRTQEADLPRSVALNYLNTAADYQSGTEIAQRSVTKSANDLVVQLPMATTAARAAQAADVQLHDAWNERNQFTTKVSRKYAFLDAGDVITIEYPQGSYSAKRITQANDTGQLIELTLLDSDAAIYAPTVQGASPPQAQVGVALAPNTALALLDIPILRDVDNNPGLYAALAGFSAPWPGAVLYVGPDDASLAPRGGVSQATIIGNADSALGNWSSLVMDQSNTLLVTIGPGTLASAPRDSVLDAGANLAALGASGRWEIIAFTTAALVAGTQYQLSGLLRGLYGTEAQAGTHQIGDQFVLLQFAGMLRPTFDLSELGQPRNYRPITTGQSINSAASVTLAETGIGIKPYNPVNLRRSTDASNNITLTWDRRTRSSVDFPANGVDVPLFETTEAYQVDIFSSNTFATVVRTIATNSSTAAYTAAQQTADGLTPGAVVNVRVYQIGAAGRGSPLQGTI